MAYSRLFVSYILIISCAIIFFSAGTLNGFQECKFPAIFNFGDSNSDTGAFSAALFSLSLPYGSTYFGKPSGRFSDGRVVIDFIANNLGLPFLSGYLDSLGANYSTGVNFAVGGSTILLSKTSLPLIQLTPFYLSITYTQFTQFMLRSKFAANKGMVPKQQYFSEALYTIDIGQNDIGNMLINGNSIEEINATIPTLVDAISTHVKGLYSIGARSFWIHNTGPVGCLPYVLAQRIPSADQVDEVGCAIPYNNLARFFNTKLKEAIDNLRVSLPLAAITYVNIFSIKYSFFTHPEKYGFSQPLDVCCGIGAKYNYDPNIYCGVTAQSCSDPTVKVNWDGSHYTEAANKIIFDLLLTGKFSDPPIPPRFACNKFSPHSSI